MIAIATYNMLGIFFKFIPPPSSLKFNRRACDVQVSPFISYSASSLPSTRAAGAACASSGFCGAVDTDN